uniref:Methylosome subunit pICln n=1 Tax=Panagrolaimus sp. JU765 TaxID=591449 RepID=A0AC34RBP0_9BILA
MVFRFCTMIELKTLSAPVDDIYATQPNVLTFWESDNLGMGTLYLTAHTVTWMNEENKGFILTYPAIAVHAASGSNEQFNDPSLFLLVDVSKTDILIHPDEDEQNDDDEEFKTASIRFVPEDSGSISHLYQTMNTCQELNPDPKDEMDSSTDDE